MRTASIKRKTTETCIQMELNLDGRGVYAIETGCGFLNHMLELFARHGRMDLKIDCQGDTQVDYHHTVEDVGIALGQAVTKALGDMRGIRRYGSCTLPMDEALILCALDISGRSTLRYQLEVKPTVGDFDTELTEEFFLGFCRNAKAAVHIRQLDGENTHHIIEGAFKAFGRALAQAVEIDRAYADEIPSTKGIL